MIFRSQPEFFEEIPFLAAYCMDKVQQEKQAGREGDNGRVDFAKHAKTDGESDENKVFGRFIPNPA